MQCGQSVQLLNVKPVGASRGRWALKSNYGESSVHGISFAVSKTSQGITELL